MALRRMNTDWLMRAFPLERALASALDQATEALAILDPGDGAILHSNAAFSRLLDSPSHQVPRPKLSDLFQGGKESRTLAAALQQACTGKAWEGQACLKTKTGKDLRFEAGFFPVRNGEGTVESLVARLRDVTPEDGRERDLRLAEKLSALGTLAGGVAHDFNNLIGIMLNAAEHLDMQIEQDSPLRRKLEMIQQAGERAKGLTAQILNFNRRKEGTRSLIDLTDLAAEVANLLQSTAPGNVKVRRDLASGIRVYGDPSQLHQVILNLGINASQAMQPNGGTLSIQLQPADTGPWMTEPPFPGPCVQLTVEDTGCGMDPNTLERIFEPFFTTKEAGHGTGLGLSVVHDIILGHGGSLQVSSKPGQGSSFRVLLPVNQDRRSGPHEKVTRLQVSSRHENRSSL